MSATRRAMCLSLLAFAALAAAPDGLEASPVLLSDMPAYNWCHGCGPTTLGMIAGYWDLHGYPNMLQASGQDVFLTANVQDEISSPAHNAKYDPTPDDPNLPVPPSTSLADFMCTSVDPQSYGGSTASSVYAFQAWANYKGYSFRVLDKDFSSFSWSRLTAQIDQGRPLVLTVDCNGGGVLNHMVPCIGYDDRGAEGLWYACYTTWSEDETPAWYPYQPVTVGEPFGIGYVWTITPLSVPEPTSLLILALGSVAVLRWRR